MKLLCLNIGIKIDNSDEVCDLIISQNADIVVLQEVMRHFDDSVSHMYKSERIIRNTTKTILPFAFFGPLFIAKDFTKNGKIHRNLGGFVEQGNEIFTRFKINEATNEFYYGHYSYDSDRTNFYRDDHSRAVQVIELNINDKKLQIINVHGTYSKDKQDTKRSIKQCNYILNVAKRKKIPTIIAGDFNLFPDTESINILNKQFRNLINEYGITSTRPSFDDGMDRGDNIVDYIFISDDIKVNNFNIINTQISDHFPLFLDFDIL